PPRVLATAAPMPRLAPEIIATRLSDWVGAGWLVTGASPPADSAATLGRAALVDQVSIDLAQDPAQRLTFRLAQHGKEFGRLGERDRAHLLRHLAPLGRDMELACSPFPARYALLDQAGAAQLIDDAHHRRAVLGRIMGDDGRPDPGIGLDHQQ